jgi:hypothetical protein
MPHIPLEVTQTANILTIPYVHELDGEEDTSKAVLVRELERSVAEGVLRIRIRSVFQE